MKNLFMIKLSLMLLILFSSFTFLKMTENSKDVKLNSETPYEIGVTVEMSWLQKGKVEGETKTCVPCKKNRFFCVCVRKFDIKIDLSHYDGGKSDNLSVGVFNVDSRNNLTLDIYTETLNDEESKVFKNGNTSIIEDLPFNDEIYNELKKLGYKGKNHLPIGEYKVKDNELNDKKTYQITFNNKVELMQKKQIENKTKKYIEKK